MSLDTVNLTQRVSDEGTLTVSVPENLRGKQLKVVVILQPSDEAPPAQTEKLDARGWPVGFFDRTYGSLAEEALEQLPQGEIEVREPIE